jgi:AcrR family transcriptional regulator
MYSTDEHSQSQAEREHIRAAALRLKNGTPTRSNGSLTASSLATEAGVSRQRLYEHHADLIAEFRAAAGTNRATTTDILALKNQLADARARIQKLESQEAHLLGQIRTLHAVIAELTHEAEASNVIRLKPS